jgi:dienelactone hydrolase
MKKHLHALGKFLSIALFLLVLSTSKLCAQNLTQTPVQDSVYPYIKGYYESLPVDYNKYPAKKYPLLIFIHGIGELGNGTTDLYKVLRNGPPKLIDQHQFPDSFVVGGKTFSFIVISPQLNTNYRSASVVKAMIDYCVKKYRVDESRIYLTGLSMGGGISWIYAASTGNYASRIASLLVVAGNDAPSTTGVKNIATTNLPVWATHNIDDPTVSSSNSIRWVDSLNAYSPSMNPKAMLNLFNAATHDAWTTTYNPAWKPNGVNVYEWLLQHTRPSAIMPNQEPVVNAGLDQSILLPKDSTTLTGTATDADGRILSYHWTMVSGPSCVIKSYANAQTKITGLIQGTYSFRLTATDDAGDSTSDNINITVNNTTTKVTTNKPPVANAGLDKNIALPTDSIKLVGSGTDADGTISKYRWNKVSGPAQYSFSDSTLASPKVKNLVAGTYIFRLVVKDNSGAYDSDTMKLIVNTNTIASAISSSIATSSAKYVKVNIYGGTNPYTNSTWNNWSLTPSTSNSNSGNLKYSDGTTSTINAVLSHSQNTNDNYVGYGSGMAPAEVLRLDSYDAVTRTLTISGLSTSKYYSIELYASRRSTGNSTIFTISTNSDTIATYNNLTNKAIFNNLVPNAQGNLVVTIKNLNQYNYLNGFTITENSSSQTASVNPTVNNSSLQLGLENPEIIVNPNSFTDRFLMQINNTNTGTLKVQVIDMSGAVRKEFQLMKTQSGTTQFYLSAGEVPTGTYILKAQMTGWTESVKVIKK